AENRMRLEPVALFAEALALLPHPAFALLGSAHLLASPRQLIPRIGQRGLGLLELRLGLTSPVRFETLCQGLALSSVPRQQPSVPLRLIMSRPLAAKFLVKPLGFMNDGRGLMMHARSIEHAQGVFFFPAQPAVPRSFHNVVEETLAAEPDGSRGLTHALQGGLHPAEMNRDQIQGGPV